MGTLALSRFAISISAGAALLAGCGGSQPSIGAPGVTPQTSAIAAQGDWSTETPNYKASGPLLYVTNGDPIYNRVTVYDVNQKNPKPIAQITKDVNDAAGACIDKNGTLYVDNEAGAGWISEYALGHTKPLRIITRGINTPAFCAIDATGNLWVTNIGLDNVTEYLYGSKTPHTVITNGLFYPDGIAIDDSGNLYVGNLGGRYVASNIVVYPPGSKSPSRTITDGITWPVGIAVDSNGNLYVANSEQNNVEEYHYGKDRPYQTITEALHLPDAITVNAKGWLYVGNTEEHYSGVLKFPPRSLKPSKREISFYFANGLAYYPPLLP
jgi:sugar lactone lactonase YvrE